MPTNSHPESARSIDQEVTSIEESNDGSTMPPAQRPVLVKKPSWAKGAASGIPLEAALALDHPEAGLVRAGVTLDRALAGGGPGSSSSSGSPAALLSAASAMARRADAAKVLVPVIVRVTDVVDLARVPLVAQGADRVALQDPLPDPRAPVGWQRRSAPALAGARPPSGSHARCSCSPERRRAWRPTQRSPRTPRLESRG